MKTAKWTSMRRSPRLSANPTSGPCSSEHRAAQHFRDAPRLGDASLRLVRRIGVENLGDGAEPEVAEVLVESGQERLEPVAREGLPPSVDEGSDEPSPDRPLVVRRVPRAQVASIARLVPGLAWP